MREINFDQRGVFDGGVRGERETLVGQERVFRGVDQRVFGPFLCEEGFYWSWHCEYWEDWYSRGRVVRTGRTGIWDGEGTPDLSPQVGIRHRGFEIGE